MGIDLGLTGAVVALDRDGVPCFVERAPVIRVAGRIITYDFDAMRDVFERLSELGGMNITMESAIRINRSGSADTGTTALRQCRRLWLAALTATRLGAVVDHVSPARWQASMLRGLPQRSTKARSIAYVRRRWPNQIDLMPGRCRTPHDGIADAACLAAYGLAVHVLKRQQGKR